MNDFYGITYDNFRLWLNENNEKASKADIIFPLIYSNLINDFNELPINHITKDKIINSFYLGSIDCIEKLESDAADKYLFRMNDGSLAETVLMKHEYGYSVCVSTQVGCNMGCSFCRSGRMKKVRNLTAGEITEQLIYIRKEAGIKITGVAIMGIGEPFDNFDNVSNFIDIITYQKGFDIGIKHITVSTCGVVPKIYELIRSKNPINLAVSLHAPTDKLRDELMPINRKYKLNELMEAVKLYSSERNRRITLEYVMLKGVNDSIECAENLSKLIGDSRCYVNIIRYNRSDDDNYESSDFEQIMKFYDILKKNGISVTMRREMGASVNAACGQLRADHIDKM